MISAVSVGAALVAFSASAVSARQMTVTNNCAYTVWPGMFTDMGVSTSKPDHATGWEAAPGTSESFEVPDDWKSARIWGRTDCDFSGGVGATACATGSCNGGLECDGTTGTGVPPATVAEWTLVGDGNQDWYDVSLVDGSNIPMAVTNNVECGVPSCPVDLDANCPAELVGPNGSGCLTACAANVDGNQQDSANCCSGSHDTAATCPPEGVDYYDYFKDNCPDAYAYAYDESSGTALWTCNSDLKADYTLTFCP